MKHHSRSEQTPAAPPDHFGRRFERVGLLDFALDEAAKGVLGDDTEDRVETAFEKCARGSRRSRVSNPTSRMRGV